MNRHPAPMRVRLLLTIPLLAVAACSTKRDPLLEPIEPATTIPVTSTATATTLPPPSTTPAPVEVPTTPPPTEPPTTSLADVEQAVRQAVIDNENAYLRCMSEPASCDPSAFAIDPMANRIAFEANDFAKFGTFTQPGPEPTAYRIDEVAITGDRAQVKACRWDTALVLGPDGPDGMPTIINDEVASYDVVVSLARIDGTWKNSDFAIEATYPGENVCAA